MSISTFHFYRKDIIFVASTRRCRWRIYYFIQSHLMPAKYFFYVFEMLLLCLLSLTFSFGLVGWFVFSFQLGRRVSDQFLCGVFHWFAAERTLGHWAEQSPPSLSSLLQQQCAQPPGEVGPSLLWEAVCLLRTI